MTELREKSRHHNKVQTKQSDDIASLLNLPNMDAYKLWNLTAHQRKSVIKEVGSKYYKRVRVCGQIMRGHTVTK